MMNKTVVIESLVELRAEIEKELSGNKLGNLAKNYERGIELCNEMIASVKDENLPPSPEALLGRFSRYAVDSLPWTGEIMKKYGETQEVIKREYSINKSDSIG